MKNVLNFIYLSFLFSFLFSCAATSPYHANPGHTENQNIEIIESDLEIFLMGDLDIANPSTDLSALNSFYKKNLNPKSKNQVIVYLGNTIAFNDIPDEDNNNFESFVSDMKSNYNLINPKGTKCYFIPGDNEWKEGKSTELNAIQESKNFLDIISDDKINFLPKKGCGEPEELVLNDNVVLVLNDSQWIMQGNGLNARKKSSCEIDNNADFISFSQDIVSTHKDKNIIFANHHPVYTNGKTAGNYPIKNHFVPLPIIGTIITVVRKIAGNAQQFGHPDYEAYRAVMKTSISNCEGCITISSHDKSLQHHNKGSNHFIVSGSPVQSDYARKGDGAQFVSMQKGFTKLISTKSKELWMEFYGMNISGEFEMVYRKLLSKKKKIDFQDKSIFKDPSEYPDSIEVVASEWYGKKRFLRGEFYRKAWSSTVKVPLLWLDDTHGGLKPVQQGGGFQTKSLRLENEKGQQWVLRSINKDVEKVVPPELRGTFIQSLFQDGIAAAHPYGAFVIPILADAAKIYHANPKAIYLPHQEALGQYDQDFAERLYLFEERPGGNTSEFEDYDYTKKTINTLDLLEELSNSHKHVVDQKAVWRARLFDVMIGDWDRHDDQWRWASFKYDDKTIYRPIPRDRDQVFFKNDGILDYFASRPFIAPGLRKFEKDVDFYPGLIFNARHFDRSFLHATSLEEVLEIAEDIQNSMTDEIIEKAFLEWPKNIRDLDADDIIDKLKSRRSKLKEYARFHHKYINKEVTVAGTNDDDYFDIELLEENKIRLKVYHDKKDENHLIYNHVIDGDVTKELRLFGLKKGDRFFIRGENKSTIKIRIVGGSGNDKVENSSSSSKIIVYDKDEGMTVKGNNVKENIKDVQGINKYDRKDWALNKLLQFPMVSFYTDEGIGLSYNVFWIKHGFRKKPFKSSQNISLAYFNKNKAIVAGYNAYFPEAFGKFDFGIGINASGPTFTQFYYGLGNKLVDFSAEFPSVEEAGTPTFHIVRGVHIDFNSKLVRKLKSASTITINPSIEYMNVDESNLDTRYYLTPDSDINSQALEARIYGGLGLAYSVDRINQPGNPTRGFAYNLIGDFKQNFSQSDIRNLNISTELKTYFPFDQNQNVILAMYMGGAITFGDYEFFHANYLSNQSRLRAYKTNRFAGDKMAYHSTDLRIMISHGKGALPISFGIFTSFDYGRVWYDGDGENNDSDAWHSNYGGGIFFTPLDQIGFRIGYFKGNIDSQLTIGGAIAF